MILKLRVLCKCGGSDGLIQVRSGQNVAHCVACGVYQYCVPKSETGEAPRRVVHERDPIKPKQRARIIERDGGRCFYCHGGGILHVSHILSVDAGKALGVTGDDISDDENLVALCETCNLGMGNRSMPVRFASRLYTLLQARKLLAAIDATAKVTQ